MKSKPNRLAGVAGCLLLCLQATATMADDYAAARTDLIAAYQSEDYAAMVAAAERALEARPGFAGALFNLALARALHGDAEEALAALETLLAQDVDLGAADLAEFESLHTLPGWSDYVARVTALHEPAGTATVAYRYMPGDFVPEGIAIDPDGGVFLGSIRNGTIVHVDDESRIVTQPGDHWSVYGMRLHQGRLWFVSSAVEQFAGLDPARAGRNALFSVDPAGGQTRLEVELPESSGWQVLGDLEFSGDDLVFLADQTDGVVYSCDLTAKTLSELVPKGTLGSPQGMAIDSTGEWLYVADYIGGLFRVDIATGSVSKLATVPTTSDYGIDGLYRYGDDLVAIQNGIRPNRVTLLELSDDGLAVTGSRILAMNLPEFDEPNLGEVVGDRFYFIANSHWNRFDEDGNLPDGLSGPIVMKIELGGQVP